MPSTYFTSDTHFGHTNIIRFCNRPFANVHEMNVEMTNRWNSVVTPDDTVYHIGDFSMYMQRHNVAALVPRLNGKKILILGNHDRQFTKTAWVRLGFIGVHDVLDVVVDGLAVHLRHVPTISVADVAPRANRVWMVDAQQYVTLCLAGHVHERWMYHHVPDRLLTVNVGVDQWDFTPRTLAELLQHRPVNAHE